MERIISLRISPVNVSVHTTDPELRVKMLRNPRAGESIDIMRRLARGGITMNCQIVCCPGLNDAAALQRTMEDLSGMYPAVKSVSVVPVGLTRFRQGLYPLRAFTAEHAAETIDLVTRFGDRCLERLGGRVFFCGDELYLKAGRELPPDGFYEDYPQLENGVGMLRLLMTEFSSAVKLGGEPDGEPFSIATGTAAAPFFERLLGMAKERYGNIDGKVYAIENDFFGRSITVAGLVTGGDLIRQLRGKNLGRRLLISWNMLRRREQDFLDDVKLEEAATALGVPVCPVNSDGFELFDAMCGKLPKLPEPDRSESGEEYYQYN